MEGRRGVGGKVRPKVEGGEAPSRPSTSGARMQECVVLFYNVHILHIK